MIIEYTEKHLGDCLDIFDSNQSEYFTPDDRDDFEQFLKGKFGCFYILELNHKAIACGGFWFPDKKIARLTWGMVNSKFHKLGYGTQMLKFRLDEIKNNRVTQVKCETSQLTSGFFEKFGFQTTSIIPNGFGPNINQVNMLMEE